MADDNGPHALSSILLPSVGGDPDAPREQDGKKPALDRNALKKIRPNQVDEESASGLREVARRQGVETHGGAPEQPRPAPAPPRELARRPTSPIAPHAAMPLPGEDADWSGSLRLNFPVYALEQLQEFCHRHKCTQHAAVLMMMKQYADESGNPYFFIRPEDLRPDRRRKR